MAAADKTATGLSAKGLETLKDAVGSTINDYVEAERLSGAVVRQGDLSEIRQALAQLPETHPCVPFFTHVLDEVVRIGVVFAVSVTDLSTAVTEAIDDAVRQHELVEDA